jgi:hypothetical protein
MITKKHFAWAVDKLIQMKLGIETEKRILKFLEEFFAETNPRFDAEKFRAYYWERKNRVLDVVEKGKVRSKVEELKAKGFKVKVKQTKSNENLYFVEGFPPIDWGFFDYDND